MNIYLVTFECSFQLPNRRPYSEKFFVSAFEGDTDDQILDRAARKLRRDFPNEFSENVRDYLTIVSRQNLT